MRGALSFVCVFAGWLLSYSLHILGQVFGDGFGYITDRTFWLFWPAVSIAVWWLVFVLPISFRLSPQQALMRVSVAWIAGAAYGAIGYLVIDGFMYISAYTIAWSMIVGAVAAECFALLLRTRLARPPGSKRLGLVVALFSVPFLFLASWVFIVWPALQHVSPKTAYLFSDHAARQKLVIQCLQQVGVGAPYEKLRQLLPHEFPEEFMSRASYGVGGRIYSLTVEDGIITRLEFGPE